MPGRHSSRRVRIWTLLITCSVTSIVIFTYQPLTIELKKKIQPCIQTDRNHGCGLAHFSAHGGNHAGGDGRTSAHHQRLFAAQQPLCHEQISAGDIEDQTFGAGQIGRRYFADGYFAEDKPNPMSAVWECSRMGVFSNGSVLEWECSRMGPFSFGAYRPLTFPDLPDARFAST